VILLKAVKIIGEELRWLLRLDLFIAAAVCIFLLLFLPSIARYADNAVMLASSIDDEPFITMQLDGMTVAPYGHPGNYLKVESENIIPAHWYNLRYTNLVYYGGLYLDIAFAFWMPLKWAGVSLFPAGPILLRALAILFSALFMMGFYNFCRKHLGVLPAVFGVTFLMASANFLYIGTMIHPDSLLFFILIVALALAIRHLKDTKLESAVALGVFAGLGQSAKMAGTAPLIPLAAVVILVAASRREGKKDFKFLMRTLCVGAATLVASLAAFFLTTPYAIFDNYYRRTWDAGSKLLSGDSPVSPTNFLDWLTAFKIDSGLLPLSLALVGSVCACLIRSKKESEKSTIALLGLSLSIFVWYATFQKFWVQLQYLIIPIGAVGAYAGYFFERTLQFIEEKTEKNWIVRCGRLALCLMLLVFFESRFFDTIVRFPLTYFDWRLSTSIKQGHWAAAELPPNSGRILLHYGVYFDPEKFPDQKPNGGPIRYVDIETYKPTYFTITQPHGGWMLSNFVTEKRTRADTAYGSLRLYQDLFEQGQDGQFSVRDPGVSGVTHIKTVFREKGCYADLIGPWQQKWNCVFNRIVRGDFPIFPTGDSQSFIFKVDIAKFPKVTSSSE